MDQEERADRLTDLHIEVLKDLVKGGIWESIREKHSHRMEELGYERAIIEQANRLTFDDDHMLIGAYPISPLPTAHKITIAGVGTGYAMCVIDALGATHTFNAPVSIESTTAGSSEPVELTISAGSRPKADYVVTYNKQGYDSLQALVAANAQLATTACPSINFYASVDAVPEGLEALTFEEALVESEAIFSRDAIRDHILNSILS